jgi:hypothetical protein
VHPLRHHSNIRTARDCAQRFADLGHQLLLNLQTVCKLMRQARHLREADDLARRNIRDRHVCPEWQKMMFTQRIHPHPAEHHHLPLLRMTKHRIDLARIVIDELCPPARKAFRRPAQALAVGILANRLEEIAADLRQAWQVYRCAMTLWS